MKRSCQTSWVTQLSNVTPKASFSEREVSLAATSSPTKTRSKSSLQKSSLKILSKKLDTAKNYFQKSKFIAPSTTATSSSLNTFLKTPKTSTSCSNSAPIKPSTIFSRGESVFRNSRPNITFTKFAELLNICTKTELFTET